MPLVPLSKSLPSSVGLHSHSHLRTAKVVASRTNPSYTLALKQQLLLNYRFVLQKGFCKRVDMGPILCDQLALMDGFNNFKTVVPYELINIVNCIS